MYAFKKQNRAEDCCRPDNCLVCALVCAPACVYVFDSNRIDNLIVIHIQGSQSIVNVPCEFNSLYKHILAPLLRC